MAKDGVKDGRSPVKRREFLKAAGAAAFGAVLLPPGWAVSDEALPSARAYLLVDSAKCQGCLTCMLACSLAHEGRESLSLSRIQIMQDPFAAFPHDITVSQCRQCVDPVCVKECIAEAITVDAANGNVRSIDRRKCIGCMACVKACPHAPSRAVWDFETGKAVKCDLCAGAAFWKKGGFGGKQACVEVCPVKAVRLTLEIPAQSGHAGYDVNMRGEGWKLLGYGEDAP